MHTIWFRLPERSGHLSAQVPAQHDLTHAQEVWDRLSGSGFEMISTRP